MNFSVQLQFICVFLNVLKKQHNMSGIKLAFKLQKIPRKWSVEALVGLGSPS